MRSIAVLFLPAAAVILAACASSPPRPEFSSAVHDLGGVTCPEERIEVVETREAENDTVYVLDACGKRLEVVQGLVVPKRKSEFIEITADEPSRGKGKVDSSTVAIVRSKVQEWCVKQGDTVADADAIAFYGSSLDECRNRLDKGLVAVGTERDDETGEVRHWFRVGQYLFAAKEGLSMPQSRKAVSARYAPGAVGEAEPERKDRSGRVWFGRVQLAPGYLATRRSEGPSLTLYTELGAKLGPDAGLAFVIGSHSGFHSTVEENPHVLQFGLAGVYYPTFDGGLRLDGGVSIGALQYGLGGDFDSGPLFAAGVGYDFGARGKKTKSASWTGFGTTLRGFYTFSENAEAAGVGLYLGVYVW